MHEVGLKKILRSLSERLLLLSEVDLKKTYDY